MTNTNVAAQVVEVKELTKADKALLIFTEESAKGEDKLRARVIERLTKELGMGKPGASTYFQNCKTKAKGEKVKHYYKPKTERKNDVDNSTDSEPESFEVTLKDGSIECFINKQDYEAFVKDNADKIAEEVAVEA